MRKKRILAELESLTIRVRLLEDKTKMLLCGQRGHKWHFEKVKGAYYFIWGSSPRGEKKIDGYVYKCENCGATLTKPKSAMTKAQLNAVKTLEQVD